MQHIHSKVPLHEPTQVSSKPADLEPRVNTRVLAIPELNRVHKHLCDLDHQLDPLYRFYRTGKRVQPQLRSSFRVQCKSQERKERFIRVLRLLGALDRLEEAGGLLWVRLHNSHGQALPQVQFIETHILRGREGPNKVEHELLWVLALQENFAHLLGQLGSADPNSQQLAYQGGQNLRLLHVCGLVVHQERQVELQQRRVNGHFLGYDVHVWQSLASVEREQVDHESADNCGVLPNTFDRRDL